MRVLTEWRIPDEGAIHIVKPSIAGLPNKTQAFSDWLAARFQPDPPWLSTMAK
ncbi:hypothetical protein [Acidisoma cladoniae]|uniref:hypothetical protein n=1 Tax=Acidisoma cladoniae TaxID=3040935 RepID=UPI0025516F6C|nr:hypothetical protein [Acidisoma sp. PAMC 29798]